MRIPTSSELLDIWERGGRCHISERYVPLFSHLYPDQDSQCWPLGRHDLALFHCRAMMFGDSISCYLRCEQCEKEMEFSLSVRELTNAVSPPPETINVEIEGQLMAVRLPTCRDLRQVHSREQLLHRCIDKEIRLDDLTSERVELAMGEGDPMANLRIDVDCPHCHYRFLAHFDIGRYFWGELERLAKNTLRVVHRLASRYGWSEIDILAMSAWRRRYYLELIGG